MYSEMARVALLPLEKECRKYIQVLGSEFNNCWIPKIMDQREAVVYVFSRHGALTDEGEGIKQIMRHIKKTAMGKQELFYPPCMLYFMIKAMKMTALSNGVLGNRDTKKEWP